MGRIAHKASSKASKPSSKTDKREDTGDKPRHRAPGAFWSGTLTFGLVSVPVELHAAHRSSAVSLRSLGPQGRPLRRQFVCPAHETPVDRDDIVRGYEIADGRFVTVTDDELEALQPDRSREIDLRRFTPRTAIDPIYCDRAYFLLPPDEISKPYRLLAATMEKTGRAGIATFVMRGRAYTIAIFAEDGILRAETLRHADEVRSAADVGLPEPAAPAAAQVKAMQKAIKAAARDAIDQDELRDVDAAALRARALEKAKAGEGIVEVEAEPEAELDEEGAEVIDIMALLRARLGAAAVDDKAVAEPEPPAKTKTTTKTKTKAKTDDDLGALSKKDLYARAQAREIEGRSAMSKEELIEALAS